MTFHKKPNSAAHHAQIKDLIEKVESELGHYMLESLSLSIISDRSSLFSLSYIFISEMAFINFFFLSREIQQMYI